MSLGHLTLATRHVDRFAAFLTETLGYGTVEVPANSPVHVVWLDIGHGQHLHLIDVPDFVPSAFENEFGRHIAMFYPLSQFPLLQQRLVERGAVILEPLRATPFERFFFREPVNGYLFEVIDDVRAPR